MNERSGRVLFLLAKPAMHLLGPVFNAPRARVLLVCGGEVLLVRSWFGRQHWSLPGGGITKGEEPGQAACRELHEEAGIRLDRSALRPLLTLRVPEIPFDYVVFAAELSQKPGIVCGQREIIEAGWWPLDGLPQPLSPAVPRAIESWRAGR